MLRLEQQPNRYIGEFWMRECAPEIEEIRTGRPGKIVDVFLIVLMGRGAIGIVSNTPLHTGCSDRPARRHRDPHVVDTVVGVELGCFMELVTVPSGLFEHTDLGKPLGDEEVLIDDAGAREGPGDPRCPLDFQIDGVTRGHRLGHRNSEDGLVVLISVIG